MDPATIVLITRNRPQAWVLFSPDIGCWGACMNWIKLDFSSFGDYCQQPQIWKSLSLKFGPSWQKAHTLSIKIFTLFLASWLIAFRRYFLKFIITVNTTIDLLAIILTFRWRTLHRIKPLDIAILMRLLGPSFCTIALAAQCWQPLTLRRTRYRDRFPNALPEHLLEDSQSLMEWWVTRQDRCASLLRRKFCYGRLLEG